MRIRLFFSFLFTQHQQALYARLDALYQRASERAKRRYELGDITLLESLQMQAKATTVKTELGRLQAVSVQHYRALQWALNDQSSLEVEDDFEQLYLLDEIDLDRSQVALEQAAAAVSRQEMQLKLARQGMIPGLALELFKGREPGELDRTYDGIQAGLQIPLFNSAKRADIKQSKLKLEASRVQADATALKLAQKVEDLKALESVYLDYLVQYNQEGAAVYAKTLDTAEKSYLEGAIDYLDYLQLIEQAQAQHMTYLNTLKMYHFTRVELLFLTL